MENNFNNENNNSNSYNNNNYNMQMNNGSAGKGSNFLIGMITGFICAVILGAVASIVFLKPIIEKASFIETYEQNYETREDFIESVLTKLTVLDTYLNEEFYYDYESVDNETLANLIYKAYMAATGDDYAYFYDHEEYISLTQESTGTYCGIGATVQQDTETGYIKIVKPFKNGPAFEAGIRTNDYVIEIDGQDVSGMDLNSAVAIMKGEEGTIVNVKIIRDGEEMSIDIERRVIEIETVEYEMLENNIGYVAVSSFEGKTAEHFEEAIEALIEQGAESIVVDLRDNGGGLLSAVVEMLDYLLPEGVLVYTEDKDGNKIYERSDSSCVDIEMAILINGNSASASEVFTGAMQDYEKAVIVGETSFGKGIVQTVRDLGDGTAVKYTTSAYYTPNGRNIHGTGIDPDIEVSLPTDDEAYEQGVLKREYDTQLQEAIKALTE